MSDRSAAERLSKRAAILEMTARIRGDALDNKIAADDAEFAADLRLAVEALSAQQTATAGGARALALLKQVLPFLRMQAHDALNDRPISGLIVDVEIALNVAATHAAIAALSPSPVSGEGWRPSDQQLTDLAESYEAAAESMAPGTWTRLECMQAAWRITFSEALSSPPPVIPEGWRPTHRHKARGSAYRVIGDAVLQTTEPAADETHVIVYQDERGLVWVRPSAEFYDGRFEALPSPSNPPTSGERQ